MTGDHVYPSYKAQTWRCQLQIHNCSPGNELCITSTLCPVGDATYVSVHADGEKCHVTGSLWMKDMLRRQWVHQLR